MATEIQKIGEQAAGLWTKLTPARKIALIAGTAAVAGTIALVALRTPEEQYNTLFSNLAPEDAGQILEYLKTQAVPYKISGNGSAIDVPSARVHELRIALASTGVPRGGGAGFELFDKQTFGTTSFVEQMNYQRALAGEMSRTISSIDAVARARVHLTMKERSLYAKDDQPPSASVVLALRPGRELTPPQVRGIVNLVASGVQGLLPDRVTVLDDSGSVLWSGDEEHSSDAQRDLERTLKRRIMEITDSIVGPGHSVVAVTAELDTAKTERTEELYDKDRVALRSETTLEEREPTAGAGRITGGVAGARGNLPGAPEPTTGSTNSLDAKMRSQATRSFEVNRVVNRVLGPKARLHRLHVAILIDAGTTTSSTSGTSYEVPNTNALARVAALAREAAGLDPERGDRLEVHSIPFAITREDPKTAGEAEAPPVIGDLIQKQPLVAGAAALVCLLLAGGLGAGVMMMARKRAQKNDEEETAAPQLPLTAGEIESAMDRKSEHAPLPAAIEPVLSPRDRAIEAIQSEPERAARVLAAWLAEAPRANVAPAGGDN